MSLSERIGNRVEGKISFLSGGLSSSGSLQTGEWGKKKAWGKGSCNCCQSIQRTALKAPVFPPLRREQRLGCVASPAGLGRIWRFLSLSCLPLFVNSSFWMQRNQKAITFRNTEVGNWKDYPQSASSSLESFQKVRTPIQSVAHNQNTKKLSPKHQCAGFDMFVFASHYLSSHFGRCTVC